MHKSRLILASAMMGALVGSARSAIGASTEFVLRPPSVSILEPPRKRSRMHMRPSGHWPHQGKQECARRQRQSAKIADRKAWLMSLDAGGYVLSKAKVRRLYNAHLREQGASA